MLKIRHILDIFSKKSYFVCLLALVIFSTIVLFKSFFVDSKFGVSLNPIIIFIIFIVQLFALLKIRKKIISKHRINALAIVISLSSFVLLLLSIFLYFGRPMVDLINLESEAFRLLEQNDVSAIEYFSRCYNNFFTLVAFAYIYRLAAALSISPYILFSVISAASISSTFYLSFLTVRKISGHKNAFIALLALALNPVFYVFASYFYTDILIMPIMSITIFIATKCIKEKERLHFGLFFLLGAFFTIGMKVRPTTIIPIVAFAIVFIFTRSKFKLKKFALISLGLIVSLLGCKAFVSPIHLDYQKDLAFPTIHWVMMGLNSKTKGQWNAEDFNITHNEKGYEARKAKDLQVISQRLSNMSPTDFFNLLIDKLSINWSAGHHSFLSYSSVVHNINPVTDWISGNKKTFIFYIMQSCNCLLFFLTLATVLREISRPRRKIQLLPICLFGAFLFYLVWETSPKYSFSFVPLISALAFMRFGSIQKVFEKRLGGNTLQQSLKWIVFSTSIFILILACYHYSFRIYNLGNRSVYTINSTHVKLYNFADNASIQQSFIAIQPFNNISIRVKNQDSAQKDGTITLSLLDESGQQLYNKTATIKEVKDGQNVNFRLPSIRKHANYKLTVTGSNNLSIYALDKSGIDFYPSGVLSNNNEPTNSDLQMNISLISKRPIVSAKLFIPLAVLFLSVEAWALNIIPAIKLRRNK